MTPADLESKFFGILSTMLKVPREQLGRHSSRGTLDEWDSLKHMHLMLALEEEFDVEFSDVELSELSDVPMLIDALNARTMS